MEMIQCRKCLVTQEYKGEKCVVCGKPLIGPFVIEAKKPKRSPRKKK